MRFLVALLAALLVACAGSTVVKKKATAKPRLLGAEVFGEAPAVVSVDQLFSLTASQRQDFLAMFEAPEKQEIPAHERIYEYLEGHLTSFEYYSETLVASQALSQNRGNCLSLAILTKALADLAKVEVAYQLVETEPVYQKEGNIVVSSQHVRTVLFKPRPQGKSEPVLFLSRIVVDYFPTYNTRVLGRVSENEFRSMFYNNVAASALVRGDMNESYWNLRQSLEITPSDANAVNMMALLHVRVGHPEYGEPLYLFGLEHAEEQLELLNNYHNLLKRQGRLKEAEEINERIGRRNNSNPFRWISLGDNAFNAREFYQAIRYYRRASKLAPYLHEPHVGIARAQYQLGHHWAAHKEMKQALENVHREGLREIYEAKLKMLSDLLGKGQRTVIKSR